MYRPSCGAVTCMVQCHVIQVPSKQPGIRKHTRWSDWMPALATSAETCFQVSAFGDDNGSDTGDVWTVHGYHAKDKIWERDADIELKCVTC